MARRGARQVASVCIVAILLFAAAGARAQPLDEPPAGALTGILKRIKETGVVRLGYREHAVPFSFAGSDGRPHGYSIDLCHAIVEDIAAAAGAVLLRVEYRKVTPSDRFEQVVEGRIDLECGTTTANAERRRLVEFSPLVFVTGTRLLVKRGAAVRSLRDLPGRKVVVARGTTNEEAMHRLAEGRGRGMTVVVAENFERALAQLASSEVDALAADDILIAGLLAQKGLRGQYAAVGELLSFETYGIMFARADAPLAGAVQAAFRRLAVTRELRWIYDKWFRRTLPSGLRFDVPMSPALERSFEMLGLPPN
ncbi:MAG: amino acid ABC transporter substrate-binding protein [Betaproteobacteria bacterium]|nr:amino acid ABC transporter substrate-binding protein [Betaproteobacteria bacterium]